MKNKNKFFEFSPLMLKIKHFIPTNICIIEFVCPKAVKLSWNKFGFGWKEIPQNIWSFSSPLQCHDLEGIIFRFESSSLSNYNIDALINCYIFDRNITIYFQQESLRLSHTEINKVFWNLTMLVESHMMYTL